MHNSYVVIPNWNGKQDLPACLDSLLAQSLAMQVVVVENGSTDGSLELLQANYPQVELVINQTNLGFAGGVNSGIRRAIELGATYVALFNNDAVADPGWAEALHGFLESHPEAGTATCKLMDIERTHLDSTGDIYTNWGLPYPRGRGEPVSNTYDQDTWVFAASGGASMYRVSMLQQIGLFDEDFFAYFEDVDISFRAQLAGWKVAYVPGSIAYHQIGATSGKLKGFTTYQFMKNVPWVFWKNVPHRLMPGVFIRLNLAYTAFFVSAVLRGQGWPALRGYCKMLLLLPKKLVQRHRIQQSAKVDVPYIRSIMVWDLPPNAHKLRILRSKWWKLTGRTA
jgi:GT2 family glycosyltransferase